MAEIVLSTTVSISDGPKLTLNRALSVDAYDKIDVVVPAGVPKVEVAALPGDKETVQFLLIAADRYSAKLTYKVGTTTLPLDGPHQFCGNGAVQIFYALKPMGLEFKNTDTVDINVQILVGRDATP
jgi:hypothetical protein